MTILKQTTSYSITLDSVAVGDATATLSSLWSNVQSMRSGYFINSNDGGKAVITEVQYQSNEATVTILEEFGTAFYNSEDWYLTVPQFVDVMKYLPENFRSNEYIKTIMQSFEEVMINDVNDSIYRLNNAYDPIKSDKSLLKLSTESLGFFSDILNSVSAFDEESYRKLLGELGNLYSISGTGNFINFIKYISGIVFDIQPLWTADYVTFTTTPTSGMYLTSRVQLDFNLTSFPTEESIRKLVSIFYYLAPTNLMIQVLQGETPVLNTEFVVNINNVQPDYSFLGFDQP